MKLKVNLLSAATTLLYWLGELPQLHFACVFEVLCWLLKPVEEFACYLIEHPLNVRATLC